MAEKVVLEKAPDSVDSETEESSENVVLNEETKTVTACGLVIDEDETEEEEWEEY